MLVSSARARPRLDGLLETALYVDDPQRSASFYERVFGFQVIDAGERLIAMRIADRQVLLLFKKGASAALPLSPHDGSGRLHVALAVPAGEIDAWKEWLQEQAVTIVEERTWERGGRSLYFRDPDGHLLEVASPGVWSIY
jgi:catechol 2,3-dioxygenase-like lactoylglutathione lyase family enzyme